MPADRDLAASASARFQRAASRRAGLAAFLRWWLSELAPLVPRSTRAAVRRRRMRPVFAFEGDSVTLWTPVMRGAELVTEPGPQIALSGDAAAAAGRAALDSLAGIARGGAPRVVIALPGRQTLRRTLALPAALEENLKQALAYDLDRHTPFKADELYFDAAIIGRDAVRGEIRVDLAAVRRGIVDQAVQVVEGWGAQVVAVVPDVPASASASRLNLLPEDLRPAAVTWRRWQVLAPIALLAAIALAGATVPIWQKREYAIALGRQVDTARSQAAVSEGLRTELERLTGEYNFALERKYAFPPTVQVLDEITKLLPDDTWLTQMELKTSSRGKDTQRELMLRGESGNAGRLITLFEESKVFAQAAPRSPTTKIQPGPGEIFDLVAQLRSLPAPVPVAVAGERSESGAADPGRRREAPAARREGNPPCPVRIPSAPGETAAPSAPPAAPGDRHRQRPQARNGTASGRDRRHRCPAVAPGGNGAGCVAARRSPTPRRACCRPIPRRRPQRRRHRPRPRIRLCRQRRADLPGGERPHPHRRKPPGHDARLPQRRMTPGQQRAARGRDFGGFAVFALSVMLVPVLMLHGHYDEAIADTTDRVDRMRRVAAQAPELGRALEAMKARDGRRFFLKNTAPNLAGAELQELVKAAVESNGGRITTSQNTSARDDGRFEQIGVNVQFFATTPALQRILAALESQQPYTVVDNLTVRPLNAFRGFKPAAGAEPEVNVQLDVVAFAYAEPASAAPAPGAAPAKS